MCCSHVRVCVTLGRIVSDDLAARANESVEDLGKMFGCNQGDTRYREEEEEEEEEETGTGHV